MTDSWYHPTPLAVSLTLCAGLVAVLALALGSPELMIFAAPMIGWVSVGWGVPAVAIRVGTADEESAALTCFESERVEAEIVIDIAASEFGAHIPPVAGLSIETHTRTATSMTIAVTAERWGRYSIPIEIAAVTRGGLAVVKSRHRPVRLTVHPLVVVDTSAVPDASVRMRVGGHPSRFPGAGSEFAGIRPFVSGDGPRSVNWRATARRGSLYATERRLELAGDVVIAFDATLHRTGSAFEPLDRAVRGAAELAWSALRSGDRVGLINIGDPAGWYPVRGGRRQFHGIVAVLIDPENVPAQRFSGTVPPPVAVPAGATVVAYSALLDSGFTLSLLELGRRGHRVVVVDVMPESMVDHPDPLVGRLWSFERAGMYRNMGIAGIEVRR
ncbi:DUF58 domain-containing protein [Nocardia pseudobrasiliensis]|uniref:Uncharacterized protein (DUF58 family) n=1 Tax=Nocardia pseudobrasiliensis TaxID=45979 RepID=A0A370IBQ3_9NOCA|nr:DUF58 domain-containing protein [Nocardia pseudobrasiliensis]RDI68152.1 uncharacterized protein (DUF58 family) [Nocardia pseudobrasiliensis]